MPDLFIPCSRPSHIPCFGMSFGGSSFEKQDFEYGISFFR
uniref:Uncharacterized protein n=1 Tax=Rhizophora mucronata TaxID=61149 RepID=A0A2P2IUR9_RHIMU